MEEEQEQQPQVESHCGKFVFVDGTTYDGQYEMRDGKVFRVGIGMQKSAVEEFTGEWADDMMSNGKIQFSSGSVYEGDFKNGKYHGEGTFKWKDNAIFEGSWIEGKMHGKGKFIDADGIKWEGQFINGRFFDGEKCIDVRF